MSVCIAVYVLESCFIALSRSPKLINQVANSQISELLEFIADIQLILDNNDKFIWWKDKHEFNVQNSYTFLMPILEADMGSNLEALVLHNLDKVWNSKIPSNMHVFCWRLLQNCLPIISQLKNREVLLDIQNSKCSFYGSSVEDDIHLFLNCPFAATMWSKVSFYNNNNEHSFQTNNNCFFFICNI